MISSTSSVVSVSTSNDYEISYISVSENGKKYQPSGDEDSSTASTTYDYTSNIRPTGNPALYRYSHASSFAPSANTFGTVPRFSPISTNVQGTPEHPSPHPSTTDSNLQGSLNDACKLNLPVPCICVFRPMGNGTMALYPPKMTADQTPLYVVGVSPNCFVPTSFVTTVESGRTERLIATFEMGPSRDPPTLFTDNTAYQLDEVLKPFRVVKSLGMDRWNWERGQFKLHWTYETPYKANCSLSQDPNHTPIATLTSAAAAYAQVQPHPPTRASLPILQKARTSTLSNSSASSNGSIISLDGPPMTQLRVTVAEEALLDEIVVSALVVERKRLMPKTGVLWIPTELDRSGNLFVYCTIVVIYAFVGFLDVIKYSWISNLCIYGLRYM
ncbi:hypothetical protein BDY19DRAFT_62205 [Irpex rosettiformis]|uniref:Uncharacterized protein n=1 Tax=Irpex rosettiformis TaxID=378272 RepID=A0ACB8UNG1_9APHY|nr:hypothetical protein BDY19DRAFT_62205 [Irpex rosettiformis]